MTGSPEHRCRHCTAELSLTFADLGSTPVANDLLSPETVLGAESYYPLRALVCRDCRLVQLQSSFASSDLFRSDYSYFSSYSTSWLDHSRRYAHGMIDRLRLSDQSRVIEIASNDGYLLQFFQEAGIPVLGIEPSRSVADVAINEKGIPTEVEFFGQETARRLAGRGMLADLTVANNVLAHVPDINDFARGFALVLKPGGAATFEFPHLLNLIRLNQFDTIYHEHYSYLSLLAVERIFGAAGLRVFDVEELPTHGGSLRVFACRGDDRRAEEAGLDHVRAKEAEAGLADDAVYVNFAEQVRETKRQLFALLSDIKRQGKSIVGYGAPAKGNSLLNYCGIGRDMLDFTVDRSPHKQGMYLPGTRLEIRPPEAIDAARPDYVLILPWNLKTEIVEQMSHVRSWGGQFIVPIPVAEIVS
jgi:SAM-dependent methyltransferase